MDFLLRTLHLLPLLCLAGCTASLHAQTVSTANASVGGRIYDHEQKRNNVGVYFLHSEGRSVDNSFANDTTPVLSSLVTAPPKFEISTLLVSLSYTLPISDQLDVSFDLLNENLVRNTAIGNQNIWSLTLAKTMQNESRYWLRISPNIPGIYEAWQDPYLVNSPLESTDADLSVMEAGIDYINGSPFSLSASYGRHSIENDQAGFSQFMQIAEGQRSLLQRDLWFASVRVASLLLLTNNTYIEGGLTYFKADADGSANSFESGGIDVELATLIGQFTVSAALQVQSLRYDSINPIFNLRRDDTFFELFASFSMPLFDEENLTFEGFVGVSERESNISFFDETSATVAIGLNYVF